MKDTIFEIKENINIAKNVYRMTLAGDVSAIRHPGEFINIRLDGFYLRRPISVYDVSDSTVTIIYKAVGKGTAAMAEMAVGETLQVLTGLGNGYDLSLSGLTASLSWSRHGRPT